MARVRYMDKHQKERFKLYIYPSFSATGSIVGMKKQFYGKDALLVRSGGYIYNVPPHIYYAAH